MNDLDVMRLADSEPMKSLSLAAVDAVVEAVKATAIFGPMYSAHQGYAVALEELDELWTEIKVKQPDRDLTKMRAEAIQLAAVALCFAVDICNEERGRR